MKPVSTGDVTKLSSQPERPSPINSWTPPDSSANHTANSTHWALPGSAKPVKDELTSRHVNAVGPTDSRVDAPHSTATSAGKSEA